MPYNGPWVAPRPSDDKKDAHAQLLLALAGTNKAGENISLLQQVTNSGAEVVVAGDQAKKDDKKGQ